jgi:aryl-alcohol dehydrogenase-like predicted oxidoreductase
MRARSSGLIAHRYGRNSAELAIAWVLRQPRVTAAIVGARKPGQIKETVFGGKFAIKPEDLARIDEALAVRG